MSAMVARFAPDAIASSISGVTTNNSQSEALSEFIWHLLGDSDAFVRWRAARSVKDMVELGLVDDVDRLLDHFDVETNASLFSEEHYFAFLNAQQWLLMGLARAALYHGKTLEPLKSKIAALATRADLHVINKLHLARCLKNIEGKDGALPETARLWSEIEAPFKSIVARDGWPDNKDRRYDFGFEYEFEKYRIAELARMFWLSDNEAGDFVAEEVIKRWPGKKSMSEFPGQFRYRGDERFETYREHVQRHARLHAATTLVKSLPVSKRSYDWEGHNPWREFLEHEDVSFGDGSWLTDHKDCVPPQAKERLLGERKNSQETLLDKQELFRNVGFPDRSDEGLLPLFGRWTSPDGVDVNLVSALVPERGSVKKSVSFAKTPDHDLWLPRFGSDGRVDRFSKKGHFIPLLWEPEKYPIGIDERDEWSARGAIARPKLGRAFNRLLGLHPDDDERYWQNNTGKRVLESVVWGKWRANPDGRGNHYQDDGAILWADQDWLDGVLLSCKVSIVCKLDFWKYKSSNDYDDASGAKAIYVGLRRQRELTRFWFAKLVSEKNY